MSLRLCTVLLASLVFFLTACGDSGSSHDSEVPRFEDYLRGERYLKVVMEVDSVASAAPSQAAQAFVQDALNAVVKKPLGVEILRDQTLAPKGPEYPWTLDALGALVQDNLDLEVPEHTIKMHAVFLDGYYAADSGGMHTLGMAWPNHQHMVLFKEKLSEICSSGVYASLSEADRTLLCRNSESAVWLHQVGHLLGLVNKGVTPTSDHEDPEHPGHTKSEESVMHWSYEWSSLNGGVVDQSYKRIMVNLDDPLDFGEECEADLSAFRTAP